MPSKFLKIENPCSEKWEQMHPNEKGRFCDHCAKTVIDFTKMNDGEIVNLISKAKGNLCGHLNPSQLNRPLIYYKPEKSWRVLPYSSIAASLLVASSLNACEVSCVPKSENPIEQFSNFGQVMAQKSKNIPEPKSGDEGSLLFRGRVIDNESKLPIENAKITLITITKVITVFSDKDGNFEIEIPNKLVDDDNVIVYSFEKVENKTNGEEGYFFDYEEKREIYSKNDLNKSQIISANRFIPVDGGIGLYIEKKNPLVVENGVEIDYKEFAVAQQGKKSSCSLENKEYIYFSGEYAVALYGEKAKDGLYLILPKE